MVGRSSSMPGLQRPSSCGALKKSNSLARVPPAVRLDMFRHSTPVKGPMGRLNMKQVAKSFKFQGYTKDLAARSVTLEQLLQIKNYAVVNCYTWGIPASSLNFYHIQEWVVRPATRELNSAMFEHLSDKKLMPNWFVSHYWGEHLESFLEGLRQHLATRNLAGRTGYWMGAFASRHLEFSTDSHTPSAWAKVAEAARFRLLLVMDCSFGSPMLFTRTWCSFELALCLECTALSIDVAAVCNKDVEVLTSGLTSSEICSSKYCPGVGIHLKQQRESNFPLAVVKAALDFQIQKTRTSREEDRDRLLRSLCVPGDEEEQVEAYQRVSRRLRSLLLLAFWPYVLGRASSEKAYMSMLTDMAKAIQGDFWRTSLALGLGGCDFTRAELFHLALHSLPSGLGRLKLDLQFTKLEDQGLAAFGKALPAQLDSLQVNLQGCGITDKGVFGFLKLLPKSTQQVSLKLQHSKVSAGLLELSKDGPSALLKWCNLSYSERAECLAEKLEMLERKKNPMAAPPISKVNRKMALENLALLAPNGIKEDVLQHVQLELALLEASVA